MLATQKSFITRALARLGSENAFQILQRAREIEATGRRVVHMEIGEPDFDTPDNIKRAAVDSLLAHDTHYTPSQGTHELREVVAEYASRFRKMATPYTAANVTISPGAKPIIWNILSAILDHQLAMSRYFAWLAPATLGIICGGVLLVTLLEYGQVKGGEEGGYYR